MATSMDRERVSKTRACAECKAKKLRCCASREAPATCHRCYQHGIECTVPEKRPRKRPSRLHTRMATLENMVGSLVDRLPGPTPHTSIRDVGSSARSSDALHDPLTRGLLSMIHAESLCRQYRQMAEKHFPCVLVPRGIGVRGLQHERPVLFQAMLVVASWQDKPQQASLESFFLGDLSSRFFVKGERSLDLLQGLLVYLAWYHFNVAESGQYHAYRLASLCATMIVDLGINQKPPRATHESTVHCQTDLERGRDEDSQYWSHEARRTLIGVYIQSSLCSIMCQKPSPLPYSTYMEQCAGSLQEDPEVESDKSLLYFIQVVRIINDVYHVFVAGDADRDAPMGDDQVQMAVRALKDQLSTWRTSLPQQLSHHAQLHTWGDLAGAYVHEIGLHGHVRHGPISATRVSIMFDCLAHVEAFMDRATAISHEDMQTWTAFDWRQLTYTTMLASKISVAIDAATADQASTERIARLHNSLDVVSTRTQELLAMTHTPVGQGHYFQNLLQQWKGIRSWYQAVLQNRRAHHEAGGMATDDPIMSGDLPGGPVALQSLDSWPDDNFGILPISMGDLMMLESLDYPQSRVDT